MRPRSQTNRTITPFGITIFDQHLAGKEGGWGEFLALMELYFLEGARYQCLQTEMVRVRGRYFGCTKALTVLLYVLIIVSLSSGWGFLDMCR